MTADVLDRRALNRALLARQLLLRRHQRSATDAIWSACRPAAHRAVRRPVDPRLDGFAHAELAGLLTARAVVRIALMRSTVHLNIHRPLGTPASVPKPTIAGPGRPKGSRSGPAQRRPAPRKQDQKKLTA